MKCPFFNVCLKIAKTIELARELKRRAAERIKEFGISKRGSDE